MTGHHRHPRGERLEPCAGGIWADKVNEIKTARDIVGAIEDVFEERARDDCRVDPRVCFSDRLRNRPRYPVDRIRNKQNPKPPRHASIRDTRIIPGDTSYPSRASSILALSGTPCSVGCTMLTPKSLFSVVTG